MRFSRVCRATSLRVTVAVAVAAVLSGAANVVAESGRPRITPAHYIVFEVSDEGVVRPLFHRRVELATIPGPVEPGPGSLLVEVEDRLGSVVFRDRVEPPRWVRGEFHGERMEGGASAIDGHRFPVGRSTFVVRVPAVERGRVVIEGRRRAAFDLDSLARSAESLPLAGMARVGARALKSSRGANPANRVDLLIMGDGYVDQSSFESDAAELQADFFGITPYDEYANFVNVTTVYTASAETGADHPPYNSNCSGDNRSCCSDTTMLSDPLAGTYVATAFDARFCSYMIHRLLVVDVGKVLAAAAVYPDWDAILVVVNDTTYGGSGGTLSVSSTHSSAVDVSRHEYGHAFTDLADEYESSFPGYPACSDVTAPACEANVTDETNAGLIKWAPWIDPSTPIPTPEILAYRFVVGLFEGARYRTTDMYRPRDRCLMRVLGVPFGEICAQEYIRTLYGGGWGVPAGGIDSIEPGSEDPPTAGIIDATGGVTLSVDLLQPVGSPPLEVIWLVDGLPARLGGSSFEFVPPAPGTYDVELRVNDRTPLVHPDMAGTLLTSSRNWTLEAVATDPGRLVDDIVVRKSATAGNLVVSWSRSCSPAVQDYAIYEGAIGSYYSHTIRSCTDTGILLTEEITPEAGSRYFLVVPSGSGTEGSYGVDSSTVERPPGLATCHPTRAPGACP